MYEPFQSFLSEDGTVNEADLKAEFLSRLAGVESAEKLFDATSEAFEGEELVQVCGEIVSTINAECDADDFHNWDYDHLEFIIDLSNRYGFTIPRNLLNGLPEQLIILVDADKLGPT
ncbi:MAG: hypothetical protein ACOC47_05635, partial [Alkalispirochaetaceae bacterium]